MSRARTIVVLTMTMTMMLANAAHAEFRHIELKTLGMD